MRQTTYIVEQNKNSENKGSKHPELESSKMGVLEIYNVIITFAFWAGDFILWARGDNGYWSYWRT